MGSESEASVLFGVIGNVIQDDVLRPGARVLVVQIGHDRTRVRGLNHGGRNIDRWVSTKALCNFRATWLHDGERKLTGVRFKDKQAAAEVAQNFNDYASKKNAA